MPFKSKSRMLYGDLVNEFKPTIKSLIFNILYAKFVELRRAKDSFVPEDAKFRLPVESGPYTELEYLAVVKGNRVVEMIRVNSETSKLLQSRGVKFVPFTPTEIKVKKGMKFVDGQFVGEDTNEKD
jgi:hypothetical protein